MMVMVMEQEGVGLVMIVARNVLLQLTVNV